MTPSHGGVSSTKILETDGQRLVMSDADYFSVYHQCMAFSESSLKQETFWRTVTFSSCAISLES